MKKNIICLSLLLILLLCACGHVQTGVNVEESASDTMEPILISPEEVSVSICGERISVMKDMTGEGYTLYLPSYIGDITWSLTEAVSINGEKKKNGDSAEILLTADDIDICGKAVKIMRSENIPALFLTSDDGSFELINSSADHSYSTGGSFSLLSDDGELLSAGRLKKIRGRGNSTWNGTEKKPYQIELSSKMSLLGLSEAKKYILLANYYDPSLLRNRLAFEIAEAAPGYSPEGVPIDLYGCGKYLGSYLLCEKIEIDENKIAIEDLESDTEDLLVMKAEKYEHGGSIIGADSGSSKWYELPANPEDITGGYLLEVDYPERYPEEASGFVTDRGLPIVIVSPEYASKEQVEYIRTYVCDFEDALYSETGLNEKGKHYSEYANMESLVFRYLFEEFLLNIDGGISSFHIYKDSEENGGKLTFSCVWDYDCAFGNYNKYADLTSPDILFEASSDTRNNGSMPSWFYAMMARPEIAEKVSTYYKEHFRSAAVATLEALPTLAKELSASAKMDQELYGSLTLRNFFGADSGKDYDEAVEYLYSFIENRIKFFDIYFS